MKETVLIRSYSPDTKKFVKTMAIIGLVIAMIICMSTCSNSASDRREYKETYQTHREIGSCGSYYAAYERCSSCRKYENITPLGDGLSAPGFWIVLLGFPGLALLIKLLLSSFELVVTDKRVYCKILWIHHSCVPIDSITAVSRVGLVNSLMITAPSARIMVTLVVNAGAIYDVLIDQMIERQQKPVAEAAVVEE